jgi:hypothetical protein
VELDDLFQQSYSIGEIVVELASGDLTGQAPCPFTKSKLLQAAGTEAQSSPKQFQVYTPSAGVGMVV